MCTRGIYLDSWLIIRDKQFFFIELKSYNIICLILIHSLFFCYSLSLSHVYRIQFIADFVDNLTQTKFHSSNYLLVKALLFIKSSTDPRIMSQVETKSQALKIFYRTMFLVKKKNSFNLKRIPSNSIMNNYSCYFLFLRRFSFLFCLFLARVSHASRFKRI